jgi:hypothetical protein
MFFYLLNVSYELYWKQYTAKDNINIMKRIKQLNIYDISMYLFYIFGLALQNDFICFYC